MLGRGLAVAALVVIVDQVSKRAVLWHFQESGCALHKERITPFFELVQTCNAGVSFGLLNRTGLNAALFALAAVAIVIVLLFWLKRVRQSFLAISIGMIVGGAIGNVIDRLRFGGVVDFLYFHLPGPVCTSGHGNVWNGCWPAFNLADSAICVGVAAMLLDGLLLRRPTPQAKEREDFTP